MPGSRCFYSFTRWVIVAPILAFFKNLKKKFLKSFLLAFLKALELYLFILTNRLFWENLNIFQCMWIMVKLIVWHWCELGIGVWICLSTKVFGRFLCRWSFLFSLLTQEWNSLHIILTTNIMLHLLKPIPLTQDTILYHMKQDTEINE